MRSFLFVPALAVASAASAIAPEGAGNPQQGYDYAKEVCAGCHGISLEQSPLPQATPFREVANRPGVTGTALKVWLETSHPTMPNIVLEEDDKLNLIAYILSLKD
jgi:mono/diheme cytochrome c family protein